MRLFFDLDGTLTDPCVGITRCIQHALAGLGHVSPPAAELAWCIGPPLRESLAVLLGSGDASLVEEAVGLYRERFATVGMFENEVYPGVPEALSAVREHGHEMLVVTSKPHVYAEAILRHFGLRPLFARVYGSELSGERGDKASLLRHVLSAEGDGPSTWMVGDRRHDIEGARSNGLPGAGVLWGYGSRAELEAAGAESLIESPSGFLALAEGRGKKRAAGRERRPDDR